MRIAALAGAEGAAALAAAGHAIVPLAVPADGGGGATATLARCLVEFEGRLVAERVDAVLVAGSGDPDLALALAAAKLGVHVARLEAPGDGSRYGRVLALLADEALAAGDAPTIAGR